MSSKQFEGCVGDLKARGLQLDDRITQEYRNGIAGMVASADIEKGTFLCKFPLSARMPESPDPSWDGLGDAVTLNRLNSLVREMANDNTEYGAFFSYFESLDELKAHSYYYFEAEDLNVLRELNPNLFRCVIEQKDRTDQFISFLTKANPDIDLDILIVAVLNWFGRAWSYGLLPVADLFNHSLHSNTQIQLLDDGESVGYVAAKDYAAGDEIFVAYGAKDMYRFALAYNFFDPDDLHLIDYAYRIVQTLSPTFGPEQVKQIGQKYKVQCTNENGVAKMRLREEGLYLLPDGPNGQLMAYLADLFPVLSGQNGMNERGAMMVLKNVLEMLLETNNVDAFELSAVPEKLVRFYHLLQKERAMLTNILSRMPQ